ncbi:MAG: GHKL domain-containing protein [Deltaproteobacteria bacterium]|nr:GHKL domain-containing protein [Deltaproteobacteria bacterium]
MINRLNADDIASPYLDDRAHGAEYFNQIRRRLRWQLLVAYITPLLLLSAVFHYQYTITLRQEIETHLKSVAENKRNTVSLFLQERVANVKSAFHFESLPLLFSSKQLGRVLEDMQKESATFVDLGLFSPDGKLIAYAGPFTRLLGKDYSEESWFRQLMKQKKEYYISDVYLGFRHQPHFIVAARKLIDGEMWSLRASVDPKRFSEFVTSAILLKKGEALIANRKGELQTTTGDPEQREVLTWVPAKGVDTKVQEVKEKNTITYLKAYAWLTETDWTVVVRIPTEIAYAPIKRARMISIGVLTFAFALLFVFVQRRTRKIVWRLESADRAKEEMRSQLFNAAKLASVGEMATGIAHEINNPLAIIYEEAGLIKDSLDPEFGQEMSKKELEESLKNIVDATMRGRSITSKLLAFARKHDVEVEPTEVDPIINRVISIKQREFEVSGIAVEKRLAANLPKVLVNSNQMEQVLLNLLNNSSDAMETVTGTRRISVTTGQQAEDIFIAVQDTGCGVSAEQMEKIFFPFFTTKKVGKGTGLGLAISYGIVKAAGGRIEVSSEIGKGSTFVIFLPIAKEKRISSREPSTGRAEKSNDNGNRRL